MKPNECPSMVIDGKRYYVILCREAVDRIKAAGIDFENPPLASDTVASILFLTGVFAAAAHVVVGNIVTFAGLTAGLVENMVDARQARELQKVIEDAVEFAIFHNRMNGPTPAHLM